MDTDDGKGAAVDVPPTADEPKADGDEVVVVKETSPGGMMLPPSLPAKPAGGSMPPPALRAAGTMLPPAPKGATSGSMGPPGLPGKKPVPPVPVIAKEAPSQPAPPVIPEINLPPAYASHSGCVFRRDFPPGNRGTTRALNQSAMPLCAIHPVQHFFPPSSPPSGTSASQDTSVRIPQRTSPRE